MAKRFNITGTCIPELHYMINNEARLEKIIDSYICEGKYFTINRARQYGKTTLLYLLERKLTQQYIVIRLSFEATDDYFTSSANLVKGLILDIGDKLEQQQVEREIISKWYEPFEEELAMREFGRKITELCTTCGKEIVLMIDEVDKSSGNQLFLSFLGLLRTKYLEQQQGGKKTFKSVILAGVYDIKNLKLKLHREEETKYNSPWNIAADFNVDMSFSETDIAGMLSEYESDYKTGMNIVEMSRLIFAYTAGYPYLVSRLCQILDERISGTTGYPNKSAAWTREGFLEAVKLILNEPNTLFDDMRKKISEYGKLREMLNALLFRGVTIPYNPDNYAIDIGTMFGFIKNKDGNVVVSNRVFETRFYNMFLSEELLDNITYNEAAQAKSEFVQGKNLNMDLVMQKFAKHFAEVYGDSEQKFIEENGRRLFLLYLKPIINGTGNYYVEARTRDMRRTDIIVDYCGEQYIIELKIWHGEEYNKRGRQQLFEYLETYHKEKGYLLSFNFNKNKKTGVHEIEYQGKRILEAVV